MFIIRNQRPVPLIFAKVIVDPKGKIVKVVTGEDPSFYTFLDSLFNIE